MQQIAAKGIRICICELFLLPLHQISVIGMKKLVILLLFIAEMIAVALSSCNVTRVVTTRAECHRDGDTSIVIQTKTTEVYDGTAKDKEPK